MSAIWAFWGAILLLGAATATPLGLVDTVAFTDRDKQVYGPAVCYIVNDTLRGVHVVWKQGYGEIRYNFRPHGGAWRWMGGIPADSHYRNLGCMDVALGSGRAAIGADRIIQSRPRAVYLVDSAPGHGNFKEYYAGSGFRHMLAAVSRSGWPQFAVVRNDTICNLATLSFRSLGRAGPFPAYNVVASKQSGRFSYIWPATDGPDRGKLYLKETFNNGQSWGATVNLSDSAPGPLRFSLLGGSAVYDSIRLYLVADFSDGRNPNRSEIWLYAKYDTPPWQPVHRHGLPDSARIGDDALAACRPSIGRNPRNDEMYVVWEQFDAADIEPVTGLCRAGIWASRTTDRGRTWGEPVRLTQQDGTSKRFPYLAGVVTDTLHVICFADRIAGFWEQGQGPCTDNPVLYLRIPAEQLPTGVSEPPSVHAVPPRPFLAGSVSGKGFTLSCPVHAVVEMFDLSGRVLESRLGSGIIRGLGAELPSGVYFIRVRSLVGDTTRPRDITEMSDISDCVLSPAVTYRIVKLRP